MRRALILSAFVLSTAPLLAHHNTAGVYDAEKPVPLNGTVTAFQWRNPHTFVFVDVKDGAGSVVNWRVELLAGLVLSREGFNRESLHVGDPMNMTACLAKDGSHTAAAQFIFVPSAFENHRAGVCKAVSR
jgi:Family of unknown function (DUF6152)